MRDDFEKTLNAKFKEYESNNVPSNFRISNATY